jgi:DNA-binding response OmpR family regulator
MRIGLLASNAALAEYFVTALGMADHAVTLYPAVQDLFSALAAAASQRGGAPHEVLLLDLILDESGRQTLARLSGLAKDLGLPIIALTTAGRDAIDLAHAAFPEVCLRQLPLPLRALLALMQAQHPSVSSATLSSSE